MALLLVDDLCRDVVCDVTAPGRPRAERVNQYLRRGEPASSI
jgi:hypothetical protein